MNATQTSGGVSYAVNTMNANLDTGAYSLKLNTAAPYIGLYTGTLPVTFTPDSTVNGQYKINATNSTSGAMQNAPVTVTTADISNINFNF